MLKLETLALLSTKVVVMTQILNRLNVNFAISSVVPPII